MVHWVRVVEQKVADERAEVVEHCALSPRLSPVASLRPEVVPNGSASALVAVMFACLVLPARISSSLFVGHHVEW